MQPIGPILSVQRFKNNVSRLIGSLNKEDFGVGKSRRCGVGQESCCSWLDEGGCGGECSFSRVKTECDGTRAETRFGLSAKRTSLFKSAGGRQFSRLLAAEVCASAVVMLDTPCSEVV